MYSQEQIDRLPEKVLTGSACRFCEREFISKKGKPVSYGKLTICSDCFSEAGYKNLGYNQALSKTKGDSDKWALRRSEILKEIQQEVESDFSALKLDGKIRREEKKELFEDRWLPKFKQWLDKDIKWDGKKSCYTITLEKDERPVVIDFYPKGNKVLIRQENMWIRNGSQWLVKNVLPDEFKNV